MFVRVADARRDDELVSDIAHNKLVRLLTQMSQLIASYCHTCFELLNFVSVLKHW